MTETVFIFLITMSLPSGEIVTNSSIHDDCPNQIMVYEKYSAMQNKGLVIDWQAGCFQVELKKNIGS